LRTRCRRALIALGAVALLGTSAAPSVQAAGPKVLLVCPTGTADEPGTTGPTLTCPAGAFSSIQAAVTAAAAGDWVLVAPGDYHEKGATGVGVAIATANLHLRGMDRNGVVVDGTNPSADGACSSKAADQDTSGRDGIVVTKVSGTYIENLTACNYLNGTNGEGNEIWWNGGDKSGLIGMGSFWGNYITGTSTFYSATNMGMYGIFTSNAGGPGSITYAYASNMADSAFYVGACADCNTVLDHVHAENSALGYSGTNAGGHLTLQNSEWDQNKAGIVPNSLNNDDAPPPQSGLCPGSTTVSCTLITHNSVHDNNNPNTPGSGIAGAAPIGSGIELAGASFDTVDSNTVFNQGGWGILAHDFPDNETPPASGLSHCQGGTQAGPFCDFPAQGDVVTNNTLSNNGTFGNPTNSDLAVVSTTENPADCFAGNTDTAGLTSEPPMVQTVNGGPCPATQPGSDPDAVLIAQLACASGIFAQCPTTPAANYPQNTGVTLLTLAKQVTMPNPCAGVPDNPWCAAGVLVTAPGTTVPETPLLILVPLVGVGVVAWQRRSRERRSPRSARRSR
jgi:hypothetical protein